jgi:hypothetical protein
MIIHFTVGQVGYTIKWSGSNLAAPRIGFIDTSPVERSIYPSTYHHHGTTGQFDPRMAKEWRRSHTLHISAIVEIDQHSASEQWTWIPTSRSTIKHGSMDQNLLPCFFSLTTQTHREGFVEFPLAMQNTEGLMIDDPDLPLRVDFFFFLIGGLNV